MPGINLLIGDRREGTEFESLLESFQQKIPVGPDYENKVLLSARDFALGFTAYPDYPLETIEEGDYFIALEGRVYNQDPRALRSELLEIARALSAEKGSAAGRLRSWLSGADGEFLVLIRDQAKEEFFIFGDLLGRLPLYYARGDERTTVSRRLRFCGSSLPEVKFDRRGLAEFLIFGYPLGPRTLLEGVRRVPAGTLLSARPGTPEIELTPIHTFNFERKEQAGKSLAQSAVELEELFVAACRRRAGGSKERKNILSLSGGLDSRAVALGLIRAGAPFRAASFLDWEGEREPDVSIARRLVDEENLDWKLFKLKKPDLESAQRILDLKDGLCNIGMSFILDFFERIKEFYGPPMTYFTGDEGNILLSDARPWQRLKTVDELVDCIISNNAWLGPREAGLLLRMEEEEIRSGIKEVVEGYPEEDPAQRYVHFINSEYGFKLQFEGEDRNRAYFWSAAPYYSLPVFSYLMNVPDRSKSYYRLYKEFLHNLSPRSARLGNVGSVPVPLYSPRVYGYWVSRRIFNFLPPALKIRIREKVRTPYKSSKVDVQLRDEVLEAARLVGGDIDAEEVRRVLTGGCDKAQFNNLSTAILYLAGKRSVISPR